MYLVQLINTMKYIKVKYIVRKKIIFHIVSSAIKYNAVLF